MVFVQQSGVIQDQADHSKSKLLGTSETKHSREQTSCHQNNLQSQSTEVLGTNNIRFQEMLPFFCCVAQRASSL